MSRSQVDRIDDGGVAYMTGPYSYVSVRDAMAAALFKEWQEAAGLTLPYRETVHLAYSAADREIAARRNAAEAAA